MKDINLSRILNTITRVTIIFISHQASASQSRFALMASDNSKVCQGRYEELKDSIAKLVITIHGWSFLVQVLFQNVLVIHLLRDFVQPRRQLP